MVKEKQKSTTQKPQMPMGEIDYDEKDKTNCFLGDDEELLMRHVICDEHELLFLDTLLRECFTQAVN